MKICCLLPSATEIVYALGLGNDVAGVTYGCDYPPAARQKPVIVHSKLAQKLTAGEIDRTVRELAERGESPYRIDAEALRIIQPDLILTQDLCHVCAPSPDDLAGALEALPQAPTLITLNPHSLADVWNNIREVGCATGREKEASELAGHLEARIREARRLVAGRPRPRVVCLEWLAPPFIAGHWVPEMVEAAGGQDVLGRAGLPSFSTDWKTVIATQPEIIVVMPCGYNLQEALADFAKWRLPDGWAALPAVASGSIFAVDATSYFSRPGPRLVEGVETLAAIFHGGASPAHSLTHWLNGRAARCPDQPSSNAEQVRDPGLRRSPTP